MQRRTIKTKHAVEKKGEKVNSSIARRSTPKAPKAPWYEDPNEGMDDTPRDPPKSDYVLPDGRMLPMPDKFLATEVDILEMYSSLRHFLKNRFHPRRGFVITFDYSPYDCLISMYNCSCISLGEMRALLQMPIQLRLLHEHLYSLDVHQVFPNKQFMVEYVEVLRIILRLHGHVIPNSQRSRRFNYCWCSALQPPGERPFPRDLFAESYENGLMQNKDFISEWEKLKSSIPAKNWLYCIYQNWFIPFTDQGEYDQRLAAVFTHISGQSRLDPNSQLSPANSSKMKLRLHAFCDRWALTHLATPFKMETVTPSVMLVAARVVVIPMRDHDASVDNTVSPNGFEVRLPKYYGFDAISRYRKNDFAHLKYAFDMVKGKRQRKAISGMTGKQKKSLLKPMRAAMIRSGIPKGSQYRILKGLCYPIKDSTMHGLGFAIPTTSRLPVGNGGEVIPMKISESFTEVMKMTARNPDDHQACRKIFARFGLDITFPNR